MFNQEFPIVTPRQDIGLAVDRHPGVVAQKDWMIEIPFDVSYQQVIYPLNNCLMKVATATGSDEEKTYAFAPAANLANAPQPFTAEIRFSDGSNNIDYTYPGLVGQELEISAELAGLTTGVWRCFARSENTNAITAAQTAPTTLHIPVGGSWRIKTGNSWANIGSTNVAGQLYGFTWKHTTPWTPAHYMDGDLGPSRKRANMRSTTLTLTLDQEASSGFAATLRTALTSRALVPIRLHAVGPTINTGTYAINIDGMYTVEKWGAPTDHDGEDAVSVDLMAKYDSTGASDIAVTVVNEDGTLT
ncbi:MAG: hypothetical protein AB7N70_05005 [Dehalococcoidia bacterium]